MPVSPMMLTRLRSVKTGARATGPPMLSAGRCGRTGQQASLLVKAVSTLLMS